MTKRIQMDMILEDADFNTPEFQKILNDLHQYTLTKNKTINQNETNEEKSYLKHHTCNNDKGLPCTDETILI